MNRLTHPRTRAALAALVAAGLLMAAIAGPTLAAKGGRTGGTSSTSSIDVVYMDGATAAYFEARATFNVATTATAYPYVHLRCYQGSTLVLDGYQGFFPTAIGNQWFYLGPTPAWTSGGANCTADLVQSARKGWSILASTSFPVLP